MKFRIIGTLFFMCSIMFLGCELNSRPPSEMPKTLTDIAYDVDERLGYTVQIKENEKYAPYLVLTNNYNDNGDVLLLRQYLLDELVAYKSPNDKGNYDIDTIASYYETSDIDSFLNGEFYERLPSEVQNIIVESTIEITAKESIGRGGKEIVNIARKIFLLSYTELNAANSGYRIRTFLTEGKPLEYFIERSSRVAYHSNGETSHWWLRTVSTATYSFASVVMDEGSIVSAPTYSLGSGINGHISAVRPAFCLPQDISIKKIELNGEEMYVLDME